MIPALPGMAYDLFTVESFLSFPKSDITTKYMCLLLYSIENST